MKKGCKIMKAIADYIASTNFVDILLALFVGGLIVQDLMAKAVDFFSGTKEEQITEIKRVLQEIIISYVTKEELDFLGTSKMGEVKRANVIAALYEKFPALKKYTNQSKMIQYIDSLIDDALIDVRELVEKNYTKDEIPNVAESDLAEKVIVKDIRVEC